MKSPFNVAGLPLRLRLLSSTALAVAGAVWMVSAGPAAADPGTCVTTTPGGVTTITCTGTTTDQVYAGDDGTLVTLNADAVVDYDYDPTIVLAGDDSRLTQLSGSGVRGFGSPFAVVSEGNRNTIILNDEAYILNANTLYGDQDYAAVGMYSDVGGTLTLNGGSLIFMYGGTDNTDYDNVGFAGAVLQGAGMSVTLNDGSEIGVYGIGTLGENKYSGLVLTNEGTTPATRSSVTLNSGSSIFAKGSSNASANDLVGILSFGDGDDAPAPSIVLNGGSSVDVQGYSGTSSNKYMGILSFGNEVSVTLNGGSSVNVTGDGDENNKYIGIIAYDLPGGSTMGRVTLNGGSSINVSSGADSTSSTLVGLIAKGYQPGFTVSLNGGSSVVLSSYSDGAYAVGIEAVGFGTITELNDESRVEINASGSDGGKYIGIANIELSETAAGVGRITLNSGSSVTLNGSSLEGAKYVGIATIGAYSDGEYASDVTLNNSDVTIYGGTGGDGKYVGIAMLGNEGVLTLNGTSRIYIDSSQGEDGISYGVLSSGIGNSIALNGSSSIDILANDFDAVSGITTYGTDNSVTLSGSSSVGLDLSYGRIGYGIIALGGDSHVTLNGDAQVSVSGKYAGGLYGIRVKDGGNTVTLNDGAIVQVTGYSVDSMIGMQLNGDGNTVVLNGDAYIRAVGYSNTSYAAGILSRGDNASITLNDDAAVFGGGMGTDDSKGIRISGYGSSVTLNDNARVGAWGSGGGNRLGAIVLNDNSNMSVTLNDNSYATGYDVAGIYVRDANNSTVTLNGSSHASSYNSVGIRFRDADDATINVGEDAYVRGQTAIQFRGNFSDINISGALFALDRNAITLNGTNNTITLDSALIEGEIRGANNGTDQLVLKGAGALGYRVREIGLLDVQASGIWNLLDTGSFERVEINSGKLAVNGALYSDTGVYVNDGGTLGGSGAVYGEVIVADGGTIAPGNSPGTLNVIGNLTLNSGSIFEVEVEGLAADLINVDGDVTIDPGAVLNPVFLGGVDGFVGDVLTVTGIHTIGGQFIIGNGAAADYSDPSKISLTAVSSSSMNGGLSAGASTGFTFLDAVLVQAEKGAGRSNNLWGTALWHHSDRTANGGTRGFSQHGTGGAFGGNVMEAGGMTIGLAGGYIDSDAVTVGGGTTTSIKGYNAAAYTSYGMGATTLTGAVTAAYQDHDISRNVLSGGTIVGADSSPKAWLVGAGFGIGHAIPLEGGFTLTPRASLGLQHVTRESYTETGGGLGGMSVGEITTDTIRGQAGAELALMVRDPNALWSVRPSIRAAAAQEWRAGDDNARGTFNSTGAAFTAALDTRDQTYLAVGAGVDVTVGGGVTGFLSYDGGFGGDAEKSGGVRLGARFEW